MDRIRITNDSIADLEGHARQARRDIVWMIHEAKDGQLLEEGITEAGSMSSFIAAGTAHATHGINTIPFFVFYSMFGLQRIGDLIWAAGDMRCRGFLIGGTAGRTTLNGEGLQHQDGNSHLLAYPLPNLDGIGLVKALRALPAYKFTPILMLTTESGADKKNEGKAAGVDSSAEAPKGSQGLDPPEATILHDAPDGRNINEGCGSTFPEVVAELVGGGPPRPGELRHLRGVGAQAGEQVGGGQGVARPVVVEDRAQPVGGPVGPRRVGRHGDGAGIEAAEDRRHVLQARGVDQERPFAGRAELLEPGADRAGAPVELGGLPSGQCGWRSGLESLAQVVNQRLHFFFCQPGSSVFHPGNGGLPLFGCLAF